jgi:hypothetical protein
MPCTVCHHPDHLAIDQALLNRTATLDQLSSRHGLSTSALSRHKQHLLQKMARLRDRHRDLMREGYLFILNELLAGVWAVAQDAKAEGKSRLLLQAARQATAIIKFMAKLDASLSLDTVARLLASPQAVAAGSLLPTDPQFLVEGRQAVADSLLTPCPEPGSGDEALADLGLDQLQALLAGLTGADGPAPCPAPPAWRAKGGKKAGKTPPATCNSESLQTVEEMSPSSGKSPRPQAGWAPKPPGGSLPLTPGSGLTTPNWIEALDAGRLSVDILHAIGAGRTPHLDLFPEARAA